MQYPIKHISLDAWNTLLIPNPLFAKRRAELLAGVFLCSEEFARKMYTKTKLEIDTFTERSGFSISPEECVKRLILNFNQDVNIKWLKDKIDFLFEKSQPIILDSVVSTIKFLYEEHKITFSISSNTNFISGRFLGTIIKNKFRNECDDAISFMVFSDLNKENVEHGHLIEEFFGIKDAFVRCAKPSSKFFKLVMDNANIIRTADPLLKNNILHIGDHQVCDFNGASAFGFNVKLINSPSDLPDALMHTLELNREASNLLNRKISIYR